MSEHRKKEETAIVQYKARDGQEIKLSPAIIKNYLVSGRADYVTNQELFMYMGVCKSRGLNPFIGDAYLVKYTERDKAAIIVSRDYYRKRAKAQPDCVGWQFGIIVKNQKDEIQYRTGSLLMENEQLVGGWFEATPSNWEVPMRVEVPLKRYIKRKRDGSVTQFWKEDNQPEQIAKVAESQGLRAVWPDEFQGLYVNSEIESEESQVMLDKQVSELAKTPDPEEEIDDKKQAVLDKLNGKGTKLPVVNETSTVDAVSLDEWNPYEEPVIQPPKRYNSAQIARLEVEIMSFMREDGTAVEPYKGSGLTKHQQLLNLYAKEQEKEQGGQDPKDEKEKAIENYQQCRRMFPEEFNTALKELGFTDTPHTLSVEALWKVSKKVDEILDTRAAASE